MTRDELVEAIRREGAALSAAAAHDLDAAVPSCPGWDVRQLVNHLGRVHRWATGFVRSGSAEGGAPFPPKPDSVDLDWFAAGVEDLALALEEAEPDQPAWNFVASAPKQVRFWARRQACETAVHRWDAQTAFGHAEPIETELALTGVDEILDLFLSGRQADLGGTVHFHATDSPHGEWIVAVDPSDGLVVGHGHEKGDVALRATAGDLLLWLWRRPVGDDRFEVFGDTAVLDRWRDKLQLG
ncbi:MAG: hypothetical protein QOF60_2029 [Actinomycetota bacterium]|jgi:uncharacterized protein (TIGR03083 family)|nr:hypothetical protein [Actinomycetota bacterium]